MKPHPIHSKDPDVCCRFLAMSAGVRTKADNEEIANALQILPLSKGPQLKFYCGLDPADIWKLV